MQKLSTLTSKKRGLKKKAKRMSVRRQGAEGFQVGDNGTGKKTVNKNGEAAPSWQNKNTGVRSGATFPELGCLGGGREVMDGGPSKIAALNDKGS